MKKKRKVPKQTLRVSPAMMQSFIGSAVGAFVGQKVADILAGLPTVANAVAGLPKDFNPNPEPSDPLREVAEEKLREEEDPKTPE